MSSLCPKLEIYIHFLYSLTIKNDSAFYFFEINMLISLESIPTQIRMGVGSITFHARGSMKGLLYAIILNFLYVYFIKILFSATRPLISLK